MRILTKNHLEIDTAMDDGSEYVRDTRDTGSRRTSTTGTAPLGTGPRTHAHMHMCMSRSLRAPSTKPSPSLAYRHDGAYGDAASSLRNCLRDAARARR